MKQDDFILKVGEALDAIQAYPNLSGMAGQITEDIIQEEFVHHTGAKVMTKRELIKEGITVAIDRISGELATNVVITHPILVVQPNGKQQAPDFYILFGTSGIPIESKSSKNTDKITWNSGMPMEQGVYIFMGRRIIEEDVPNVTFLLGRSILTREERKTLRDAEYAATYAGLEFNEQLSDSKSKWSFYMRAMFGCSEKLLRKKCMVVREAEVKAFLKSKHF